MNEEKQFASAEWIGEKKGEFFPWSKSEFNRDRALAYYEEHPPVRSSFLFRRSFSVSGPIAEASLSIVGLGFYTVTVNRVAPDACRALTPIVSEYLTSIKYDTYDITKLLHEQNNCIAVEVGAGWFSGNPKYLGWQQTYYGSPRLLACITIRYENGESETVCTDERWKIAPGSVTESCIYDGETQDFALLQDGWDDPAYNDGGWASAEIVEAPCSCLRASVAPPVRFTEALPVEVRHISDTEILVDFGENTAAMTQVTVKGATGEKITLCHAEFVNADGTLNRVSINRAENTDVFLFDDDSERVCGPKFTWHGYRYLAITASSPKVTVQKISRRVIHSDVKTIGSFSCSDERMNRLHEVYVRTQLACLQGVPVDCPQRDERKGWLGDVETSAEMSLYNFDMKALYEELLEDIRLGVHPDTRAVQYICPYFPIDGTTIDWNLAYTTIIWECFERYGDRQLLAHHFDALMANVAYYIKQEKDDMIPPCWFGDWCTADYPAGTEKVAFAAGGDDHRQNPPYLGTVFYVRMLRYVAKIADVLGEHKTSAELTERRKRVVRRLAEKYFDKATGDFGAGGQFLQTIALTEDLVPQAYRQKAFDRLAAAFADTDMHPVFGIFGTRLLADVLYAFGRQDMMWQIMCTEGYPGFLHMMAEDRTTLPEDLSGTGSGCHCMFDSPDVAFYRMLGGIMVDRTQAQPITIAPYFPDSLNRVSCTQQLAEGTVSVEWCRTEQKINISVSVPEGLSAKVVLKGSVLNDCFSGSAQWQIER